MNITLMITVLCLGDNLYAQDSEELSLMRLVYQYLYDWRSFGKNPVWDGFYAMFAETVTINGKKQQRFTEVLE